jgi:oligopeptide/dipeptide ABC transporter ATP-binding protein
MTAAEPLFELRDLHVHFSVRRSHGRVVIRALDGVNLDWRKGEVLGIVGESGCGKSTLARTLMGLQPIASGEVRLAGEPLTRKGARTLRRRVQMVYQDPYQSLNPRMNVGALVQEPLQIHRIGRRRGEERVERALDALNGAGLRPPDRFWDRFPHELSGGQRQRVVIAAALVLQPEALICDEPVSSLDASIRAQVLHLLMELHRDRELSLIFITHDIALAWALCDRVAVMYLGRIVEQGRAEQVLLDPQHPYTRALISVVPSIVPRGRVRRALLKGELPDASQVPPGCRFHPRCPVAFDRCRADDPVDLIPVGSDGHAVACWWGRP